MKKLTALLPLIAFIAVFVFSYFSVLSPSTILANHCGPDVQHNTQGKCPTDVEITFPGSGVDPNVVSIGDVLSNVLRIVFVAAGLAVLFMLIWGAFLWITSGGDKEAVGKARGRIVAALVGLAVLALAYFITVVVGQIVGINVLDLDVIPRLGDVPANQTGNTAP